MKNKRSILKLKRPHVFLPMCLDYLHHGHVNILEKSKKYGNIIIGLISDKGILGYKKKKPINNLKKRKKIASILKGVKHILTISSPRSYAKITKKYKFDYVVHGDDWKTGPQAESRKELIITMKEWGGRVIDIPYTKKISSNIIKKFRNE